MGTSPGDDATAPSPPDAEPRHHNRGTDILNGSLDATSSQTVVVGLG
ncbi:hypothetical protein [Actinomyces sp. MRS3W]|nr:hypothetical protein [Actinomyces sp. MRS3W]MDU0347957.1 hypothetical protein [Actinomyces sp. MRS3W]